MPVRIQIDPNKVGLKVEGAWKESLFPLSSQILGDCNQYVKVDQHTLEESSGTASDLRNGRLVWDTPYAKRQYWAIQTSLTPAERGSGAKQPNANSNQTGKSWLKDC